MIYHFVRRTNSRTCDAYMHLKNMQKVRIMQPKIAPLCEKMSICKKIERGARRLPCNLTLSVTDFLPLIAIRF